MQRNDETDRRLDEKVAWKHGEIENPRKLQMHATICMNVMDENKIKLRETVVCNCK